MSFPVLQANGWFPDGTPWAEHVGQRADHGTQATFSYDGESHSTYQIQVRWEDGMTARRQLMGIVAFNQSVTPPRLTRTVPMTHPYFPDHYCVSVAYAPMKFDHKGVAPQEVPRTVVMANYDRWLLTCGFRTPKFRYLSDLDLQALYGLPLQEHQRCVEWVPQTSTFELTREGGSSFTWVEGPLATKPFASPAAQHLQQTELHAIWHDVPSTALFVEGTNFLNGNITTALNTMNDATFFGKPTGTLLFRSAQPRVKPSPLWPSWSNYAFGARPDPNVLWDVDMVFAYFNPPPFSANRGHNLCPIPQDALGRWALVSSTGVSTDAGIYQFSSFPNIFTPSNTI